MTFQVTWRQAAEDELTTIWLAATDRNAVTVAAHAIDLTLAVDADTVGRAVFDTVRQYNHPPLAVEFEVVVADCRVFVLSCWNTLTGRPPVTGN